MRLIDADVLWKDITSAYDDCEDILEIIDRQHTIEPRPRGRWIDYTDDGYAECPFCGSATNCDGNISELHYCFSCGADMRTEEQE